MTQYDAEIKTGDQVTQIDSRTALGGNVMRMS